MTVQTRPPSPVQPQTFAQFLGLLLRGFVQGLPLKLLLAGGMALLAWMVHTYLLVVSNEGFNPGQSAFLDMVLALRDRITPSVFFWTLLTGLVTTMVVRTIAWGPAKTVRQTAETPRWLFQAGKESGPVLWALLFLGGAALALLVGTIIGHRLNNLILALLFLGMIIARQSSPVLVGVRLLWSDMQRALRRPSATPFSLNGAGLFTAGLVLGFFFAAVQFFPPWGGCIGIFLLAAAMIALVGWAKYRAEVTKVAVWLIFFGLPALWVSPVFADDGGWLESGGTLSGWISSPGAAQAVGMGLLPSLGVALGVLLGFFFGGAVKVISQAGLAIDTSPNGGQSPKGASSPPPQPDQQTKVDVDPMAGQQPKSGTGESPSTTIEGQVAKRPIAAPEPPPAEGQAPKAPDPAGFKPQEADRVEQSSPAGQDFPTQITRPPEGQAPKFSDIAGKESTPTARVETGPEGSTPVARPGGGQTPKVAPEVEQASTPVAREVGNVPADESTPIAREGVEPVASQSQVREGTEPVASQSQVREGIEPVASQSQVREGGEAVARTKDAPAAKIAAEQPSASAIRPETAGNKPADLEPPGVEVADVRQTSGAAPLVPAAAAAAAAAAGSITGSEAGWYLEVTRGVQTGQRFPLGETAQLGRSPEVEIPLQDGKASRAHARLDRLGDIYRLTDLGSTNGTYVNAYRITRPVFLQDGDSIRIGDTQLQIKNEVP